MSADPEGDHPLDGLRAATSEGDRVVLEVTWTGALAVPLGPLAAGATMRARCSMHFEIHDGRIGAQRNYDCFDAW